MRKIELLNENWKFTEVNNEDYSKIEIDSFDEVSIPHSWNAKDACEGSQEYERKACWYQKQLVKDESWIGKRIFIEFKGVNSITKVYLNGEKVGKNECGFSTFRYEITDFLNKEENLLSIQVDNREYEHIYPRTADFTFFGGIYRDVNLIIVEDTHFDLMDDGSLGVYVTPVYNKGNADILINSLVTNPSDTIVKYEIYEKENLLSTMEQSAKKPTVDIELKDVTLWSRENPHLYTLKAFIFSDDKKIDSLSIPFGIRYFSIEGEEGFFLNGEKTYLKGVSRHQDKFLKGWAIDKDDMNLDMELIKEMGVNSVRLAHYQHDQHFYDLCDQNGMVVWAEVPFISEMAKSKEAHENIKQQLRELVKQNYNHPSICFWGISNEITMHGESEQLYNNLKEMDKLVKELDTTRLTSTANVMMVNIKSEFNYITDALAYNHYFGWYLGQVENFKSWFENFHEANPGLSIGCSEYGSEGLVRYHTDKPIRGDYSEEYHALYHEKVWQLFSKTPYLWGSHVWNMFDFSSKMRNEGGVKGMNNKGLVTYDRKIKKDAFYMYKASWSDEKFVHITSKRFLERITQNIDVKVYSNCNNVELFVNGNLINAQSDKKTYIFKDVELQMGENIIKVIGDNKCVDEATFKRTEDKENKYAFGDAKELEYIFSWFEDEKNSPEGYFSAKDNIGDLMQNPEARELLLSMMGPILSSMEADSSMLKAASGITLETAFTFIKDQVPFEAFQLLNEKLTKIKK